MMKTILIIEDNKLEAETLVQMMHSMEEDATIIAADNFEEAVSKAVSNNVSLFIVDIILNPRDKNDTSGIDFVETIRKLPQYKFTPVIFITSLQDKRMYAYENLHCYSYIHKPLFYGEVEKTFREALEFQQPKAPESQLKIKNNGILYMIPESKILYASSQSAKMKIVTEQEEYEFYFMTCNELLRSMNSSLFVQCNRGTIINIEKIASIDQRHNVLKLYGREEEIKIGKSFKNEVVRRLGE